MKTVIKGLLFVLAFGSLAYTTGDAEKPKVKATLIDMGGIDKTAWVIHVNIPPCGTGLPDSKYSSTVWKRGEDEIVIVCKER